MMYRKLQLFKRTNNLQSLYTIWKWKTYKGLKGYISFYYEKKRDIEFFLELGEVSNTFSRDSSAFSLSPKNESKSKFVSIVWDTNLMVCTKSAMLVVSVWKQVPFDKMVFVHFFVGWNNWVIRLFVLN